MSVCECGHNLGQHPPDPNRPFAWPCRACECNEYREVKVVDQRLMFDHLGEEVNVILHDGTSYWRRLVAVSEGQIKLAAGQDPSYRHLKTVRQEEIRSFGTREHGILEEVR